MLRAVLVQVLVVEGGCTKQGQVQWHDGKEAFKCNVESVAPYEARRHGTVSVVSHEARYHGIKQFRNGNGGGVGGD